MRSSKTWKQQSDYFLLSGRHVMLWTRETVVLSKGISLVLNGDQNQTE